MWYIKDSLPYQIEFPEIRMIDDYPNSVWIIKNGDLPYKNGFAEMLGIDGGASSVWEIKNGELPYKEAFPYLYKFTDTPMTAWRIDDDIPYMKAFPELYEPHMDIPHEFEIITVVLDNNYSHKIILDDCMTSEGKQMILTKFNKEVQKKALGDEKPITCRPADLIEPQLEKLEAEMKQYKIQDEDVLSYALFPQVATEFFKYRDAQKDKVEFLCNECCDFGCTDRKACYENVSRKNLGIEGKDFICKSPEGNKGYSFSRAMENPAFIGLKEIFHDKNDLKQIELKMMKKY